MCQLVSEKDRGFSRAVLVEILGSFDRLTADELGIDEPDRRSLAGSVQRWREALTRPSPRSIDPSDRDPTSRSEEPHDVNSAPVDKSDIVASGYHTTPTCRSVRARPVG